MDKSIFRSLTIGIILLNSSFLTAQVTVTIDPSVSKGPSKAAYFGLNTQRALAPSVANNASFKARMNELNLDFLRYHAAEQIICGNSKSWIDCTTNSWNVSRIDDVLQDAVISGDKIMITITKWPPWISTAKKLPDDKKTAFANFCADLVDIVNNQLGYNIKYWEPFNEIDNGSGAYSGSADMWHLADIFIRCQNAMKAKDPTIKVGGPTFADPYKSDVQHFLFNLQNRGAAFDLYTHHEYGGGSTTNTTTIYNRADNFKNGIANARTQLNAKGFNSTPILLGEWNIYWTFNLTGAENMTNSRSGVFDAIAYKYIVENSGNRNVMACTAWNAADGTYGKIKSDFSGFHSGGHVMKIFREEAVGEAIATTSSDNSQIEGFAVKRADGSLMIALMNRTDGPSKTVKIAGSYSPSSSTVVKMKIEGDNLITSNTTWSAITSNFTIRSNSVNVFLVAAPAGGVTGLKKIKNRSNNRYLRGQSDDKLGMNSTPGGDNTTWNIVSSGESGYYFVKNQQYNKYVYARSDNSPRLSSSSSGDSRKWQLIANGNYYRLKNKSHNDYLGLNSNGWVYQLTNPNTSSDWTLITASGNPGARMASKELSETPISPAKAMIYPNPIVNNRVKISYTAGRESDITIVIYNASGIQMDVKSLQVSHGENLIEFGLQGLRSGIYLLKVHDQQEVSTMKFSVQ
ncbi:MAG: T9SS type A sorting domain-containing protein [Bacteroidota bacterium]